MRMHALAVRRKPVSGTSKNLKFHPTSTLQKPNWYVEFGHEITTAVKKNLCELLC